MQLRNVTQKELHNGVRHGKKKVKGIWREKELSKNGRRSSSVHLNL